MRPVRRGRHHQNYSVYPPPPAAVQVVADSACITPMQAKAALTALVKAGYIVAPREPTDAMLLAYMTSYGEPPKLRKSVLTAVGKARVRWRAMGNAGTAAALSIKRLVK